jgi:hypothetical protein
MLSTITPVRERARGHHFGVTATWFVLGSIVGGALLGWLGVVSAGLTRALELSGGGRLGLAAVATLAAAGLDAGMLGPRLPHQRRQVDEAWLDEFRPWIYASGFGLQIGFGLATYVMSGGVYLVVLLGALTATPALALLVGVVFGAARGAAVLAGSRNTDPERLARFHRRFAATEAPVRRAVIAVEASVGTVLAVAWDWALGAILAVALIGAAVARGRYLADVSPTGPTVTPASASLTTDASADRRVREPTTA